MRIPLVAVAASLAVVSPAAAAVRWASPTSVDGAGSCASIAAACTLTHAVNAAPAGSEIVVLSGNYHVSATLALPNGAFIHGFPGTARPVITTTAPSIGLSTQGVSNAHVKDLEVDGPSTLGLVYTNSITATIENVVLHATGTNSVGFFEYGVGGPTVIRDTIATAAGTNAKAMWFGGAPAHVRNVTAWATGTGSIGVLSSSNYSNFGMNMCIGQGNGQVDIVASIAHGDGKDIQVSKDGDACGPTPTMAVSYSDFQTKGEVAAAVNTSGGHNLALAPSAVFVTPGSDFHELASAATIDAGTTDASTGTADVDDLARVRTTIDMGAAEFFAPAVTATPATKGPTFNGTVAPLGMATTVSFEFGPDTGYGTTTNPSDVAADNALHNMTVTPAGLDPAQTWHYRLSASQGNANYTRTVTSADAVYTPDAPDPGPPPTPGDSTPPDDTPPVVTPPALTFTDLVSAPSASRCVPRTRLRLRLRKVKGMTIVSAAIKVTGRHVRHVRGKALTRVIVLRRLPAGRFTVGLTLKTAAGQTLKVKRRYRRCAAKHA
jgi:hypothetical protein